MAETSGMFGAADDIRYYNQPQWLAFMRDFRGNGYVKGAGSDLAVSQSSPAAMSVSCAAGEAWIQGCHYTNTAAIACTIAAADATYARIDRIVLRNDITGSRSITVQVLKGIAASTPVAPTLTQTADIWEISLAKIAVAAGATSIVTANITDERSDVTVCGMASPARVRAADILTGTALDMNGHVLEGLATPTADTDGAPLSYMASKALEYPAGIMFWFGGNTVPSGYLECNGQSVLRASYPELFAVMGTTYGYADATHFNLPDVKGKCIFGYDSTQAEFDAIGESGGSKVVALIAAENPAHTHTATGSTSKVQAAGGSGRAAGIVDFATSDTGEGLGHQNLQPYIVMKCIVRGA